MSLAVCRLKQHIETHVHTYAHINVPHTDKCLWDFSGSRYIHMHTDTDTHTHTQSFTSCWPLSLTIFRLRVHTYAQTHTGTHTQPFTSCWPSSLTIFKFTAAPASSEPRKRLTTSSSHTRCPSICPLYAHMCVYVHMNVLFEAEESIIAYAVSINLSIVCTYVCVCTHERFIWGRGKHHRIRSVNQHVHCARVHAFTYVPPE